MTIRLFVALRPPPAIRDQCEQLMDGIDEARWQDDEQLHLTLCFAGAVDLQRAQDWVERLGNIVADSFVLRLSGVGHFERKGRPAAVWAGIAPCPALDNLQTKVARTAQATGVPIESRRFHPHITLARLNAASGPVHPWLARHGALGSEAWPVDRFALYESILDPGGSIYEVHERYPLR